MTTSVFMTLLSHGLFSTFRVLAEQTKNNILKQTLRDCHKIPGA